MLRKLLSVILLLFIGIAMAFGQSGALKGKIIDKSTREPVPFVNVILMNKGTQAGGASSDIDGNYTIKPITPGTYELIASFVGYKKFTLTGFVVKSDRLETYNIELESSSTELDLGIEIKYEAPLIDKDNTVTQQTATKEDIQKMPVRNATAIASTMGGVTSRDGGIESIRGQRSSGNIIYIDGIKVIGSTSLPESAIEQVSVILGGVPAQYGDATGGIINVTTRGPSREFGGGLEFETSQFLDPYGHNRLGLNLTGPLLNNKNKSSSLLGFFLASDLEYNVDGSPLSIGTYYAKDSVLNALRNNPVKFSDGSYSQDILFVGKEDLYHSKSTLNTSEISANSTLKFDIKTGKNSTLTIGGSINYFSGHNFNMYHSMFNYDRNSMTTNKTWRTFVKFTQTFPNSAEKQSLIKNVFFSIQADYSHYDTKTMDAVLKDNLFAYGYVGEFNTFRVENYEIDADTNGIEIGRTYTGLSDSLVTFERFEYNPYLANYTSNFYNLVNDSPVHLFDIPEGGGLINGHIPSYFSIVNNNYSVPGAPQSGYNVNYNNQISGNFNISGDIGNHELRFGLVYEKNSSGGYAYAPVGLWSNMTNLVNVQRNALDLDNPHTSYYYDEFGDSLLQIDYDNKYSAVAHNYFDKSLRKAMGLNEQGTEWIDLNSYDMDNHTIAYYDENNVRQIKELSRPLSVDMFSPDELLNLAAGNTLATARGYDYYGNKLNALDISEDVSEFFHQKDANGNYARYIAPYEPIYMAVYGQDKFAFEDLVFNIGVRLDRFDANQSVLADPYALYPTVKAGEDVAKSLGALSTMDPKAIVYVDNSDKPTRVVGYRINTTWYNAGGTETLDPEASVSTGGLNAGNGVMPLLSSSSTANLDGIDNKSFKDYIPQWSFMPRISFSFPISDEALFYAHYDVLTQRPTSNVVFSPVNIFYWDKRDNSLVMSNPDLKPEKTVDYELGFQQKLNAKSSLVISLFYREFRDQIQAFRFTGAYPSTYISYNNIDFGTVKGLTAAYDLRRSGNARIRASYTLQFANGTGSNENTSTALIKSNQPNLRTLFPYDYDQRHAFNFSLDYRWGEGKQYNGPTWGKKDTKWLQNTGFNITFRGGSGTPYTRSSEVNVFKIDGTVNGARLPWTFRFDARVDKDFTLAKSEKRSYYLNVYLQVLNLLNTRNIMSVYPYTGNPEDDGYLTAAENQTLININKDVQAFKDLYSLSVNSPYNYSSPRMIRVGVGLNF